MKPVKAKIHWAEVCVYPAYDKVGFHSHSFFHYIYIIQGAGEIIMGQQRCLLKAKHIYLLPPGMTHSFWNSGQQRLISCELKFSIPDGDAEAELARLWGCLDVSGTPVLGIMQNIRRESAGDQQFAAEIISANIYQLQLYLRRISGMEREAAPRDDLARVFGYIERNLHGQINLQDLANIACLEKTYFLRKFKQVTGITPMAYIRKARIKKAMELLEFSDMRITQISGAVGFQSVHYFSRMFTKAVGMSPSCYKEEHSVDKSV